MKRPLGAVACGHPVTASAAAEVLRDGGNAFDAVVAAQCAACVAEPVLASLAGGGFLLAHPTDGDPVLYDFFVQTPLATHRSRRARLLPGRRGFRRRHPGVPHRHRRGGDARLRARPVRHPWRPVWPASRTPDATGDRGRSRRRLDHAPAGLHDGGRRADLLRDRRGPTHLRGRRPPDPARGRSAPPAGTGRLVRSPAQGRCGPLLSRSARRGPGRTVPRRWPDSPGGSRALSHRAAQATRRPIPGSGRLDQPAPIDGRRARRAGSRTARRHRTRQRDRAHRPSRPCHAADERGARRSGNRRPVRCRTSSPAIAPRCAAGRAATVARRTSALSMPTATSPR